jgi:hypothetical protein
MKAARLDELAEAKTALAELDRHNRQRARQERAALETWASLERRKIYAETRAERLAALSAKGVLGQERKRIEALRDEIGRVDAETWFAKRRELLPEAAAT